MRVLWQLLSTFSLSKKDWAEGFFYTNISNFSNISWFPKILSLKSFRNSRSNWCAGFGLPDVKYCFTSGVSDLSKVIENCQNIRTRIVWKFSFALYSCNDDSIFSKTHQFWIKNVSLSRMPLISKVESFLKLNFDLNQRCNIVLTKNH